MIWKVFIAPLIFLIFVGVIIYLSKRDLEDILIQKKQNSKEGCPQCNSTLSNSTEEYQSIEYIAVQDIEENSPTEDMSESDHT